MMGDKAMMVVGHGTTSGIGIEQFLQVVEQFRSRSSVPVGYGFIELAKPSIAEGLHELLSESKITNVTVLPLLLLAAGHFKNDVPAAITSARDLYPEITFNYARDLAITSTLLRIVEERASHPIERAASVTANPSPDFTLLVGRGSTDPDANSDLFKIARLLSERNCIGEVQPAYVSLAEPGVPAALDRLRRLGANNIVVAPYFLFNGSLLQRIYSQSRSWAREHPEIALSLAGEIGPDPRIVDLLIRRVRELDEPATVLNCDVCRYRLDPLARAHGHDHRL